MIGKNIKYREERKKSLIIISLLVIAILLSYYFHFVLHTSVFFTHFFYIPVILSCIWWNRKGILVAVFLAGNLLFMNFFFKLEDGILYYNVIRPIMFIVIAVLIVGLREKTIKAEIETNLAQKKIDQIFRTTGDGLRVIDKNFNMIQFNEGFLKLLGISKDEIVGKKCYDAFHGPLCNTPKCALNRILAGEERVQCNIEKVRDDGSKIFCVLTATPLRGGDGELIGIIEDLKDITDRKLAEKALRESEERFLQSQKMEAIGRLAGGIAHDFNNLITIITGNSDLLLDELEENSPLRDDIEEIYKAGERAGSLTRQLLAFSRNQMLQTKVVDLNIIIGDIQRLIRRLIGEDIELITLLEPNLSRVKADPGQIEQVIMNLVINARDAMPYGGTLTIKTENAIFDEDNYKVIPEGRIGRFACIHVEDTGIGMDKETLSKIFEPFFSTKTQGEGTGLGLSTVYGIVKQHDGLTTVYSEPGQGSIFKIYLPALSVNPEGKPSKQPLLEKFQGNGERILLVEDEVGVRRFAKKVLDKNGYIVFEAENAQRAIFLFEREKGNFHLILSDVVLPDINGIELVDRLKSRNPELKAVLCSGYSDQKSQWPLISKRHFCFLKKPYNRQELLKAIMDAKEKAEG